MNKKVKWYSGLILSVMTILLVFMGFNYASGFSESFPNHLLTTIYCFGIIPVFIFGLFKNKAPRIVTAAITLVAFIVALIIGLYSFSISDDENTYDFEYYFDKELKTVIVKKK